MKIRSDFVTNSSSSSFLIERDAVKDKDELRKLCTKLAKKEVKSWGDTAHFTDEDFKRMVKQRYRIRKITEKRPYKNNGRVYKNHYLVDNQGTCRYDVCLIENFFDKHGIDFEWGYCD